MIGKDVMVQGRCIFAPYFSVYMQWRNMHQTSGESQTFNEITGLATFSAQVMIIHAQLLKTAKFLRYYRKQINLEHGINGKDGVMPNCRPALHDERFNERKPLNNWTQYVAKV